LPVLAIFTIPKDCQQSLGIFNIANIVNTANITNICTINNPGGLSTIPENCHYCKLLAISTIPEECNNPGEL